MKNINAYYSCVGTMPYNVVQPNARAQYMGGQRRSPHILMERQGLRAGRLTQPDFWGRLAHSPIKQQNYKRKNPFQDLNLSM